MDSIRSFDVLSQRSIENLSSVDIYPATEMILTKDQRARGMHLIELEAKKQEKSSAGTGKNGGSRTAAPADRGAAGRSAGTGGEGSNLESYVRYFYQELGSFLGSFDKKVSCIFLDEPVRIGEHAEAVELELQQRNIIVLDASISSAFQSTIAARAARIPSDELRLLPMADYMRIKNAARDFLVAVGY